ncbi:hypothetical protein [Ralstonia sp. 24A2]|uniref:hypothetical protein n=1 Tax=Ralstonia sp. 24A2 TaxID=3447364 RepID=UPI003F69F298
MNIEANEKKDKSSIGRHVKKASLYLVPGYPIYKAIKSAKETAVGGADTVRDLVAELEMRKPKTRVIRTYREALALRTPESLPLRVIAQNCLNRKRLCLAMVTVALAYTVGGAIGGSYLAALSGLLALCLPMLFAIKFEHQLWQLDTGPLRPDAPLGDIRDFFQSNGAWLRLFSPHLSR